MGSSQPSDGQIGLILIERFTSPTGKRNQSKVDEPVRLPPLPPDRSLGLVTVVTRTLHTKSTAGVEDIFGARGTLTAISDQPGQETSSVTQPNAISRSEREVVEVKGNETISWQRQWQRRRRSATTSPPPPRTPPPCSSRPRPRSSRPSPPPTDPTYTSHSTRSCPTSSPSSAPRRRVRRPSARCCARSPSTSATRRPPR